MSEKTLFTRIFEGEIPGEFVYRDELCGVLRDIDPKAPTHLLVIPTKALGGVQDATEEDQALLGHLLLVARKVAADAGLLPDGYRLVINAGEGGGQTVPHLHVHLLGGRQMTWPPG